jgi:hypothetical protein
MELNAYHIVWTVEVLTSKKVVFNHFANRKRLNELFVPKTGSKVYVITDKQFGMIQNTYNSTIPHLPKPFTHSLLIEEGSFKKLVPLSKKQFNNAVQY